MASALGNGSLFVSQSVPTEMTAGAKVGVTVVFKNNGTTTWTRAGNYRLGSQHPQDNWTWGLLRVELEPKEAIAPGQSKTFAFTVTAPKAGDVHFQWQMLQESKEWFGPPSSDVVVNVAGDETVHVLFRFHRLVPAYCRILDDSPAENYNIRWSGFGYPPGTNKNSVYLARKNGTSEYRKWALPYCLKYGVHLLTGFYSYGDIGSYIQLKSAFADQNYGDTPFRISYMMGTQPLDARPHGLPLERWPGEVDHQIFELKTIFPAWAQDAKQDGTYAWLKDSTGTSRPVFWVWGGVYPGWVHKFIDLIAALRAEVRKVNKVNPYIIMSQHATNDNVTDVIPAVDAVYVHELRFIADLKDKTAYTLDDAFQPQRQWFNDLLHKLKNKVTIEPPHLPVLFIPGAMPSYDRRTQADTKDQGFIETHDSKSLGRMFGLVRDYAGVVRISKDNPAYDYVVHKVITISTFNEWQEGTTLEPSYVRGQPYLAPAYDYGEDRLQIFSEVFADYETRMSINDFRRVVPIDKIP